MHPTRHQRQSAGARRWAEPSPAGGRAWRQARFGLAVPGRGRLRRRGAGIRRPPANCTRWPTPTTTRQQPKHQKITAHLHEVREGDDRVPHIKVADGAGQAQPAGPDAQRAHAVVHACGGPCGAGGRRQGSEGQGDSECHDWTGHGRCARCAGMWRGCRCEQAPVGCVARAQGAERLPRTASCEARPD